MEIPDTVRAFLSARRFGVLATIHADSRPHQTVMWYLLRDNAIILNTAVGRVKHRHLLRNDWASLCVADGYRYATVAGHATLIDDPVTAQADIRALAIRYEGEEKGNRQAEEQFSKQQRVTIHVEIEQLFTYGIGDANG